MDCFRYFAVCYRLFSRWCRARRWWTGGHAAERRVGATRDRNLSRVRLLVDCYNGGFVGGVCRGLPRMTTFKSERTPRGGRSLLDPDLPTIGTASLSSRSHVSPIRAGRHPRPLAKGVAERSFGRIPGHLGGPRQCCSFPQEQRSSLHAKAREVSKRRHSDQLRETRSKSRAREPDLVCQRRHRPWLFRPLMHEP